MNTNFGVVLRRSQVKRLFSPVEVVFRSWGGDKVEVGEKRYTFALLEKIEFELYRVTTFILDNLPPQMKDEELVYVWMTGPALDEYEEWARNIDLPTSASHSLEKGLLELIQQACGAAIMFAPEGDRLADFLNIQPRELIDLLRRNVKSLDESEGFLAAVGV